MQTYGILTSLAVVVGLYLMGFAARADRLRLPRGRYPVTPADSPVIFDSALGLTGRFEREGGRTGMRIEISPHCSLSRKLGLTDGDLIVGVNGHKLHSEHDYFHQLRDAARTNGRIRLEVEGAHGRGIVSLAGRLESRSRLGNPLAAIGM